MAVLMLSLIVHIIFALALQAAFQPEQQWPLQIPEDRTSAVIAPDLDLPSPSITPQLQAPVAQPPATNVQSWYASPKLNSCDRTACASCRWWYRFSCGEDPVW